MKTYKDIQKSLSNLEGNHIENKLLKSLDVSLTAHFGNLVTCEMCFNDCSLFAQYALDGLVADVLKAIVECLDLSVEGGVRINSIKDVPVRIVCDKTAYGRIIGFGHFIKDRFLLAEDLIKMAENNMKLRYANHEAILAETIDDIIKRGVKQ